MFTRRNKVDEEIIFYMYTLTASPAFDRKMLPFAVVVTFVPIGAVNYEKKFKQINNIGSV
jgi:hypothetical protein